MGNILNVVNNDNNKKPKPDAVLLEEVQMLTDMSESNINRLYEIWISYDTDFDGEMSQEEFLSIPEIAASPLKDRLMLLLNMASTETGSDRVTFNAFAILLSVMSIDGPLDKKMTYAFRIMDMNNDGRLDRKDLLEYMKLITKFDVNQVPEETQQEYLEYSVASTLNECSQNGIFITLEDFQKAMYGCDDFAQRFTLNVKKRKEKTKGKKGKKEDDDDIEEEEQKKNKHVEEDENDDEVKVEIEDNNELMSSPSKFAKLARKSKAMNKAFQLE